MTHKDILRMASDSGFRLTGVFSVDGGEGFTCSQDSIDKFAKMVAAKEREACAKVCIDEVWASTVQGTAVEAFNYASKECANRIRARGEK